MIETTVRVSPYYSSLAGRMCFFFFPIFSSLSLGVNFSALLLLLLLMLLLLLRVQRWKEGMLQQQGDCQE